MAYRLSPGVFTSEIDLTTVVPAVGTSTGAYVGRFNWGPVDEIRIIDSEVRLVDAFGKPNANTATDFFTSANFLSYSSDLRVIRVANSACKNASSDGNGYLIKNEDHYNDVAATAGVTNTYVAKYPGDIGNHVGVKMIDGNTWSTSWTFAANFDTAPGTSTYVQDRGGSADEMHIVVYDTDGAISGTANTILEKFAHVSKASDAKNEDGTSNYYADIINKTSKYIWWADHDDDLTDAGTTCVGNQFASFATSFSTVLAGANDASPTSGEIRLGYDRLLNAETVDVSLIMTGAHANTDFAYVVQNIAEVRGDCVVFGSPAQSSVVNNYGTEATDIVADRGSVTSSYGVMDSGWKYQYDKYNDVYRWIPLNGDVAGLCAYTDNVRDPWFSPAGFNRGVVKNVVKLAWNPTQTERDVLYKSGINPVVTFPGEGTILYGDKTMLSKPSAFDRINVRRLFIVLRKAISRASRSTLFEFNDEFTRAQFVSLVEPFLRDVQGRRGIYDYKVVCDESNNTGEVIDRNEFVGDIYIKPARSINFIQLNFVAVRTGVEFSEVVGKF